MKDFLEALKPLIYNESEPIRRLAAVLLLRGNCCVDEALITLKNIINNSVSAVVLKEIINQFKNNELPELKRIEKVKRPPLESGKIPGNNLVQYYLENIDKVPRLVEFNKIKDSDLTEERSMHVNSYVGYVIILRRI